MFELLLFDAAGSGRMHEGSAFLAHLRTMRLNGSPRSVTNREYFTWWAGRRLDEVEEVGREWFQHALAAHGKSLIHPGVRERLLEHGLAGDRIVLVSGSFRPALTPLAEHIGVDDMLASEPKVVDGRLSGRISRPMISENKAYAVAEYARRRVVDLGRCYAYGDDSSDLPFMELVGHPVVVAPPASSFAAISSHRGWALIPVS